MAGFRLVWSNAVEETQIFSFAITQAEGDFATLEVVILNPQVGLLNPGRPLRATFYWDRDVGGTVTLFHGRIVGVPADINKEAVTLQFQARPDDFEDLKLALAETLRVLPYWDPIWLSEKDRLLPDAVLDSRIEHWHVDRVTNALTTSNFIEGEAGTVIFGQGNVFYDDVTITPGQPPITLLNVTATVNWQQRAAGKIDLSSKIVDVLDGSGSVFYTYTGEGLVREWPKQGAGIGAGWEFGKTEVTRTDDWQDDQWWYGAETTSGLANFPRWTLRPFIEVAYRAERNYQEVLTFTLATDTQDLVTGERAEDVLVLATSEVDKPVDGSGTGATMPIGDLRRRSYFLQARGKQSLENLILRGRAQMLFRARAVDVTFNTSLDNAYTVTCRHSAQIVDYRLPGGQATGKVKSYTFAMDGSSGVLSANITLGCTIGRGQSLAPATAGTGVYVDDDYGEIGWQATTGGAVEAATGDLQWDSYDSIVPNDDGIDFFTLNANNCLISISADGKVGEQEDILDGGPFADAAEAGTALNAEFTIVGFCLKPLTQEDTFVTSFPITVTALMTPKTIDLEAA